MAQEDVHVFHAGTAEVGGKVVTNGGRVLCVTALGDKVKLAAERAYQVVGQIHFEGMQYRSDIGWRAINRKS
jgi:phosphoribosylamine--glycine ligase